MIVFKEDIIITKEDKEFIMKTLPPKWETFIKEAHPSNDMEIYLKTNAKTVEDTNLWVSQFQEITNTTYSVHNTRKCAGERLTFKKYYKCHHNTRRKETYDPIHRKNIKNTKCPSFLMINMRVTGKRYRGKNQEDKPDPDKPCEIKIKLKHNHSLTDKMASKFRKVLPEIRNELIDLYKQGHTPATALQRLKSDIRMNFENHEEILNDRSKCPDYRFCYYIYERYIAKISDQIELNKEFLVNKLEKYNEAMGDVCAKMAIDNSGYVICFCPPFVKRVHEHNTSCSSVVFIYTTNISDKNGSKIYVLLTHCEIGALPLGVIISTSKSSDMLHTAFSILKDMLGALAFGGNISGPEYFIVEENLAQKNILDNLWPRSTVLFGISFVLRSIWRWLTVKNNLPQDDKYLLFTDFYNLTQASTEADFLTKYDIARNNAAKYEQFLKLLSNYFDKRNQWGLCYRLNIYLRGNVNTEKYSENIFRIMKTKDLHRLKSFNIFQSVDYIINNFFLYFESRLLDAANLGVINSILEMKEDMPSIEILQKIKILGNNIHLVPSEKVKNNTDLSPEKYKNSMYVVNTDLLTCTCFKGYPGTICKHIQWMCLLVNSDIFNKKNLNISEIKYNYYKITKNELPEKNEIYDEPETNDDINFDSTEIIQTNTSLFDIKDNILFEDAIIVQVTEDLIQDQNKIEKENNIHEGKEIWKEMTKIYENFLNNAPEQVIPAAKTMLHSLEKVQTADEFCSALEQFGADHLKVNENISPPNDDTATTTKLMLLSSVNTHQTTVVNTPNEVAAIQSLPPQPSKTSNSGTKRILLLSGNISYIPEEKKIKILPFKNST